MMRPLNKYSLLITYNFRTYKILDYRVEFLGVCPTCRKTVTSNQ